MALSKAQIKLIQSLHQKKHRQIYGKFLVEGDKAVRELLASSFKIDAVYALPHWLAANQIDKAPTYTASEAELAQIATQVNPDQVVAVAYIPEQVTNATLDSKLYIACDELNDPGNAGTIIRIADWFGLAGVILSHHSVEVHNPKVVSAAKGSLFRTPVIYADLSALFKAHPGLPVFATAMDGQSIYSTELPQQGIILIGNEANGISESLYPLVSHKISIPAYGCAESLNAGVATGVIVSEWRRRWPV